MDSLTKNLNYKYKNKDYLKIALTHSSCIHELQHNHIVSNERMEYLGDAVLELAISEYLYNEYHNLSEGELTKFRAKIVCEQSLTKIAIKLDLGSYLYMGKGEDNNNGRNRPSILADAMEAIFGSIFLDSDYPTVKKIILEQLIGNIKEARHSFKNSDYKTVLQEIIQQENKNGAIYKTIDETGPDHNKTFYVDVFNKDVKIGSGVGRSKKEAEQNAAIDALKIMGEYN